MENSTAGKINSEFLKYIRRFFVTFFSFLCIKKKVIQIMMKRWENDEEINNLNVYRVNVKSKRNFLLK